MRYTGDGEPCLSRAMRPWRRSAVSRVLLIHFKCFKLPPSDGSGTLKMPDDDGISSRALYCTAITSAETWSEPLISTEPEWSRSAAVLRGDFAVLSWRQTVSSGQLLLCPTQSNTHWLIHTYTGRKASFTRRNHFCWYLRKCWWSCHDATWMAVWHPRQFFTKTALNQSNISEAHCQFQSHSSTWATLTFLTNLYQFDNMAML